MSAGIPQSSGVQIKQDLSCAWSGPFVVFVLFWCFSVLIKNYHHEYRLPHSPKMDKKYCIRLLSHWKVKLYSRLSFWHNFWKCFYCWGQWLREEIYFEYRYCYAHHKCMCCPVILNDVSKFVYFIPQDSSLL